jgi:preprotein translocase subunit SecB
MTDKFSQLLLDRLEFVTVNIKCLVKAEVSRDAAFPQLKMDFDKYTLLQRSGLQYDPRTANDPRNFAAFYGVKLEAKDKQEVPYEIEVDAVAFLRYEGDYSPQDRFRSVRLSGYQIMYGAIREMVANVTSRARHGTMQLPARNFNGMAKLDAEEDEKQRQEHLGQLSSSPPPVAIGEAPTTPKPKPAASLKRVKKPSAE